MRTRTGRLLRAAAALALAAAMPLATGTATASQGGSDDHKVTLCHRTNAENNPYVEITIDKAGVFQVGHDSHDEGGVYQSGDKARGVRWGDIIPEFDYYASPQDERAGTVSHYNGLNDTASGLAILANGCEVPGQGPPPQSTPASGEFTTVCTATGALVDIGTLDRGTTSGGRFELVVNGTAQTVTSGQQDIAVPANATLVLRFVAPGGEMTTLDSGTAPAACPPTTPPTTPPGAQPERGLGVVKSVSPTGPTSIGATLTYTLTVTTTGNAAQTGVTVSDYLPGYAPGTTSGTTTYVAGSATCTGSGTCTTSFDPATHRVTWGLGTMPAGTSRAVSFQVTIDRPTPAADGSIPAFDIVNSGVVSSEQVPSTSSNRVVTPVAAVQGVKVGQPSAGSSASPPKAGGAETETAVLPTRSGPIPRTGASLPLAWTVRIAGLLLLVGAGLVGLTAVRRRG